MKTSRVAFALLLLVAMLSVAPIVRGQQDADVTGIWLAMDVTYAPWTFDLKQSGTTLTGTVRQNGAVTTVAPIQGGTVRGSELSFTLNRAGAGGKITFSGIRDGATIVFTRTSEITSGVGDGLFGPVGPARATATRQPPGSTPPAAPAVRATTTSSAPTPADGLRYLATTGVAFAPWTFVLKMENGVVTGSVTQSNVDPPSGFSTNLVGPFEIQDGKLEGNQITFRVTMPDGSRVVTFKGTRNGETIAFTRSIEVFRGDGGRDGIMGINGAKQLSATLNATPVPVTAAPRVSVTPSNTPAPTAASQSGAAGRWQVNNVPGGPWIFEFAVNGTLLSGTIQQSGPGSSPVTIAGGRVEGTTLSFRVLSPDGERTITFRGRVSGNEISFVREIAVLAGGGRGGNDLFGGGAPLQFIATRAAKGNVLNVPAILVFPA